VKTDGAVLELFAVDVITDETKKFFCDNFTDNLNDNDFNFLGGKQSGLAVSLFSACAFRSAATDKTVSECDKTVAAAKRADAAAEYLNKQPHCAAFGCAEAQNGYINFKFGEEYLKAVLKYYANEFDKLYKSGELNEYLYGRETKASGIKRYCLNRIMSVCDMFARPNDDRLKPVDGFFGEFQMNLAEHCVFSLGRCNITKNDAEKNSEVIAVLFYEADSCIKNASMIYLDLYKACAYALHVLIVKEDKN